MQSISEASFENYQYHLVPKSTSEKDSRAETSVLSNNYILNAFFCLFLKKKPLYSTHSTFVLLKVNQQEKKSEHL